MGDPGGMLGHRYKAREPSALYPVGMSATGDLRVSARGQMSLPSSARHRWGLDEGGDVGYLDLGDAMVIVPGGSARVRRELLAAVTDADWERARQGFGDDELANE
jgi:bifunctional DNA-binding transcriptional regulator/antitoxin component of YhaV-PrlF toxin-antitoxin module